MVFLASSTHLHKHTETVSEARPGSAQALGIRSSPRKVCLALTSRSFPIQDIHLNEMHGLSEPGGRRLPYEGITRWKNDTGPH